MRTILITNSDELVDYSDKWNSLRHATKNNIYCDIGLTRTWLETFKRSASPRVILVEDGGELVAIAPLATSRFKVMGMPLTALSLVGWGPNTLGLVTNSIMCSPERKDALNQAIAAIKGLKWNILFTENMEDTGIIQSYINDAQSTWRSLVQTPNINHVLIMNESGDITAGFKRGGRRAINNALKFLEQDGHNFVFRKVQSDDIDRALETYINQHIERWGLKGGSYFTDPTNCEFLRRVTHAAYAEGFGFMYELLIDGEVASQMMGFRDGEGASLYRMGMSNAYSRYSPGRMVTHLVATELRDTGTKWCALGGGDQRFKIDMGCIEKSLVGLKATRGVASLMGQIMSSRPIQKVDSYLKINDRLLKTLSVERTEGGVKTSE